MLECSIKKGDYILIVTISGIAWAGYVEVPLSEEYITIKLGKGSILTIPLSEIQNIYIIKPKLGNQNDLENL